VKKQPQREGGTKGDCEKSYCLEGRENAGSGGGATMGEKERGGRMAKYLKGRKQEAGQKGLFFLS